MRSRFIFRRLLQKKIYTKIALLLIACGLLFFAYRFFFSSKTQINNEPLKIVEVEEVKLGDIRQTADLIGIIHPKHSTVLMAKADGMLDSVVATGQRIKKGMLIAKLDNPDMEKNHELSESSGYG